MLTFFGIPQSFRELLPLDPTWALSLDPTTNPKEGPWISRRSWGTLP